MFATRIWQLISNFKCWSLLFIEQHKNGILEQEKTNTISLEQEKKLFQRLHFMDGETKALKI